MPLVLYFSFDILSGVTGLDVEGDDLASRGLHQVVHLCVCWGGCSGLHKELVSNILTEATFSWESISQGFNLEPNYSSSIKAMDNQL